MKKLKYFALLFIAVLVMNGCVSVESYQKVYLNDENMELNAHKVAYYETNFQAYREGSSGANGGKTGGGCGCN